MKNETEELDAFVGEIVPIIQKHPSLQSLLYDFNLLPEQITNWPQAITMAQICAAYQQGRDDGLDNI